MPDLTFPSYFTGISLFVSSQHSKGVLEQPKSPSKSVTGTLCQRVKGADVPPSSRKVMVCESAELTINLTGILFRNRPNFMLDLRFSQQDC
jgi:hypothetical protein